MKSFVQPIKKQCTSTNSCLTPLSTLLESEETKGKTEPVTEEPAACEPKGGACGTSADEVGGNF